MLCISCRLIGYQSKLYATKRSFYRAASAIFAKVGRFASEDVILEFVSKKCVPILTYGLKVCALPKRSIAVS